MVIIRVMTIAGGVPKLGVPLFGGAPCIRTIVFHDPYWGPFDLGNWETPYNFHPYILFLLYHAFSPRRGVPLAATILVYTWEPLKATQ